MVIIILDINRKKELLLKEEKKRIWSKIEKMDEIQYIECIDPDVKYEKYLKDMYSNNYPIYKEFQRNNFNINEVICALDFCNGENVLLTNFDSGYYWVNVIIKDKYQFLNHMYVNRYFNSFSIVCLAKGTIYDIELGERTYELRVCEVMNN